MKNIKIYALLFALFVLAVGCDDDDPVQYGNEQFQVVTDPFLQIVTPVLSFQAGTPSYTMEFVVINGTKRINAVDVYKVFTDALTGNTSNEALLGTYTLDAGNRTVITDDLTYDELRSGLTVNGGPLPDDELLLAIGSQWQFRFVGKLASGGEIPLPGSVRVGVLSRFAGIYEVVESEYFRIGVSTAVWTGQTRFIGSVDDNTFSYNDFWGNFAWGGQSFNFDLNPDNTIKVPILTSSGLFSGHVPLDCSVNPELFMIFDCTNTNVLIPDDVNGHHEIRLTYGYYTNGSGPREFQEVLRKL